ncbi:dienelactone hydrolase family protein [Aerolutibacter ruishenii]|uniref:Carboxymethylenebutenolidase n=1 Tax=Aerolutibacter ruishenii TaxID=686800 RepID=A0A562LY42_9GAMM|nr:dienelactone hydrolase family protein [Lysobacter ruishenii]TWI12557.1 carboxymethylenebutenolidase [Lysobacter ruishenii]
MSQWMSLETPTGRIQAWRATPPIPPKGALVVVQEIFGVNRHIRHVCDTFAAHGYMAIAPAFFDHFEHGVELEYDAEGVARGKALVDRLGFDRALEDVHAAAIVVQEAGKVGVVGYCWGGSVAFLANTRLSMPAVSYYGARTAPFLDEQLDAPMLFHFGDHDASIPTGTIDLHRSKQPTAELHVYPAGHGFNCDQRADYDEASATLALDRTLSFFQRTLRPAY